MHLFLSHAHAFPLQEQSLLADLSLLSYSQATAGQREAEKHTNDKFMTSQTSVYRTGQGQRIKRKTPSEVKCVSFQVLWSHLVVEPNFILATDPYMYSAMIKMNVILQSYSVPFPIKLC